VKRLLALLLGTALFAAPVLVAEKTDWLWPTPQEHFGWRFEPRYHSLPDATLGWRARPSSHTTVTRTHDGEVVYRVDYDIDAFGRRITPTPPRAPTPPPRFFLFFGGSNVFGEGLAAAQTLPAQVARMAPGVVPYNYAFHGYGPHHFLTLARMRSLGDEVSERRGDAAYFLPAFHLDRLVGASSMIAWERGRSPYYFLDGDGVLRRQGSFASGRPWTTRLYRAVAASRVLRALGVGLPLRAGTRSVELLCRVLVEGRDRLQAQFEAVRFRVVLYPGDTTAWQTPLRSCLAEHDVATLDFRDLFRDASGEGLRIPFDGHPSAAANRRIAKQLVRRLGLARPRASASGARQSRPPRAAPGFEAR